MTDKKEVIDSIKAYVKKSYGGNYQEAFDAFAKNTGKVNREAVVNLLWYANVGWSVTRGLIADKIIEELDKDGDGLISWKEFNEAL